MSLSHKHFSENLIRIRKEKGLSQKDLAKISGISHRMIFHYEKHSTNPPIEKIEILAEALNVPISELLGIYGEKKGSIEGDYDVRIRKRFKKLLILNKHDRSKIYQMVDILLQKPEYKEKIENLHTTTTA